MGMAFGQDSRELSLLPYGMSSFCCLACTKSMKNLNPQKDPSISEGKDTAGRLVFV